MGRDGIPTGPGHCPPQIRWRAEARGRSAAMALGICYAFGKKMSKPTAKLNRKELFLRACRGEATSRVPVWMMRQAGRYLPEYREIRAKRAFLEVCKTPELAIEISLQPFRRLGVDAIIVFSDILIPAEALGIFDAQSETGFLMEAIRGIVREVGPTVPVLGFAGAPWTLACYMVEGRTKEGFSTVKALMWERPQAFEELLKKI